MNTPVSYELAKLLKKKEFDEDCRYYYSGLFESHHGGLIEFAYLQRNSQLLEFRYSAPNVSDVIMWLYEKHKIWISVDPENDTNTWFHTITHNKSETVFGNYNSPIEAYEKGIEHVLNEMI